MSGQPRQTGPEEPDQTSPQTFKQLDRNKKVAIATTTTLSRIRGFTVHLLFHIRNRELRVSDLVDLTGKYPQYINRYLYNMRNYGLVERNRPYWKLSEEGLSFLSYLKSLDKSKNNKNKNIYNNIYNKKDVRKKYERSKKDVRKLIPKKAKQLSFSLWVQQSGRTFQDAEKVVVEVLVDHYNRTGGKYFWFSDEYELAERFKVSPSVLPAALRKLNEDRILYVWRNKKIGLYKAFIETLEASQKT